MMVESINPISSERWVQAQSGEVAHYDYENVDNYKNSAMVILKDHFGIDVEKDLMGKKSFRIWWWMSSRYQFL